MNNEILGYIVAVVGSLCLGAYIQILRLSSKNKDIQNETKDEIDEVRKKLRDDSLDKLVDDFNKRREGRK